MHERVLRQTYRHAEFRFAAATVICAAVFALCSAGTVEAQRAGPGRPGKPVPGPAAPGTPGVAPGMMGPGGMAPGGMRPGMMPGGARPGATKPGVKPAKAKEPAETEAPLSLDPDKLPDGYGPPPEIPEMLTSEKPLASGRELDDLKKVVEKFRTVLRKGDLETKIDGKDPRQIIQDGVRYRLALMTQKDNRERLHVLREDLIFKDISQNAGKLLTKGDAVRAFRKVVNEEVTKQAAKLFDNNFYVRLHAVLMLGELDETEADAKLQLTHVAYAPAARPLMDFLRDPDQPEAIKPAAVRGLYRILKIGNPDTVLRHDITKSLVGELARTGTHEWYQMRLAETLSASDTVRDRDSGKPMVLNLLRQIIADPERNLLVRVEAARTLGRIPLDPGNAAAPAEVTRSIAALGLEMTNKMQQDPKWPYWRKAFVKLYLAFQALDPSDKDSTRKVAGGLLNNPASAAPGRDAYSQLLPVIRAVVNSAPLAPEDLKSLETWVATNAAPAVELPPSVTPGRPPANTRNAPASVGS